MCQDAFIILQNILRSLSVIFSQLLKMKYLEGKTSNTQCVMSDMQYPSSVKSFIQFILFFCPSSHLMALPHPCFAPCCKALAVAREQVILWVFL